MADWGLVCKPKREGGLGVLDLRAMNKAMLAKWTWRWLSRCDSVWSQIMRDQYGGRGIRERRRPSLGVRATHLSKAMFVDRPLIEEAIVWKLGDDRAVHF
ncbi:hypothetical protein QJS04_geneDACA023139 [Acorus gramineus]|uniref:Uncharacterized protein n=1 Tax=Acorus gramineus TaxID=55184 RepID=A0AAV9AMF3_ACOGR|nr:hypothetical protein QJS04_geneDACA023139 [Acorus gramineus]